MKTMLPTQGEILRLAKGDPVLAVALDPFRRGECDFAAAMRLAVRLLVDQKRRILFTLVELAGSEQPPLVLADDRVEILPLRRPEANDRRGA
jgi:hypothetical protein